MILTPHVIRLTHLNIIQEKPKPIQLFIFLYYTYFEIFGCLSSLFSITGNDSLFIVGLWQKIILIEI